jgi:hypothetical protein
VTPCGLVGRQIPTLRKKTVFPCSRLKYECSQVTVMESLILPIVCIFRLVLAERSIIPFSRRSLLHLSQFAWSARWGQGRATVCMRALRLLPLNDHVSLSPHVLQLSCPQNMAAKNLIIAIITRLSFITTNFCSAHVVIRITFISCLFSVSLLVAFFVQLLSVVYSLEQNIVPPLRLASCPLLYAQHVALRFGLSLGSVLLKYSAG